MTVPPDELAFWNRLAERPGDDAARLVFADWLEDRDDPRAAWVRGPLVFPWLRPGEPTPVPALVTAAIVEKDEEARERAVEALGRLGAAAVPPLLDLLPREPERAAYCLGRLGPAAAPAIPALLAAEAAGRIQARSLVDAVRQIGPPAAAVPALRRLLGDAEYFTRMMAASALGKIGPPAADAVPDLVRVAVGDSNISVRFYAVESLRLLGAVETVAGVAGEFRALLADPSGEVRGMAALCPGALGRHAAAAVPDLVAALADPARGDVLEETRRQHTRWGFRLISEQAMRELAYDRRACVAEALGNIGPEPGVVAGLRAAADDADERLWRTAVTALGRLRPAADAALGELRSHPNPAVREAATAALADPAGSK